MNLRNEFLKLLQEDAAFRMEVAEILNEESLKISEVEHYTSDPENCNFQIDSIHICHKPLSEEKKIQELRIESNNVINEHFNQLWSYGTPSQKKRKISCSKLFSNIVLDKVQGTSAINYIETLDKISQELVIEIFNGGVSKTFYELLENYSK